MKTREFSFNLPEELIAQYPAETRGESRMLVLDRKTGSIIHSRTSDLAGFLPPETLLVFNNSKVRKARIYGTSLLTEGRVEFLLIEEICPGSWKAMTEKSRKQTLGKVFSFPGGITGKITGLDGNLRIITFSEKIDDTDRKSPRLNSSYGKLNRMPASA